MLARDIEMLYVARFLAGCTGGGTLICIPLFVADIASNQYVYGRNYFLNQSNQFYL